MQNVWYAMNLRSAPKDIKSIKTSNKTRTKNLITFERIIVQKNEQRIVEKLKTSAF